MSGLSFHPMPGWCTISAQTAEAAGYPALLIVAGVCLGIVVAPLGLLALTRAAWMLVLLLLSLIAAVALLAARIDAALADGERPAQDAVDAVVGGVVAGGGTNPAFDTSRWSTITSIKAP